MNFNIVWDAAKNPENIVLPYDELKGFRAQIDRRSFIKITALGVWSRRIWQAT